VSVGVRFLGTGNAFADGGRSHACIHLTAPGASLLLDCGGSSLPAIKRAIDPAAIDAIAISHLHGDHFGGIPYLVMEQHFAKRGHPLVVGGPRELEERTDHAERALYPDFFGTIPVGFEVRYVTLGAESTVLGGAEVTALPVRHIPESDPHGFRVRIGGRLIAYSGDATWSDDLVALAKGADLFICESTHFAESDVAHVSYRELLTHRAELECDRIILTHLGAEMIAHLDEVELEYATDGMTTEV